MRSAFGAGRIEMTRYSRLAVAITLYAFATAATAQKLPLEHIKLPPGFAIDVFADHVPNARAMTLGEKGTLFVGSMFPAEYRNNIFIAEHGSWNRSQKIGYRIARVALSGNKPVKHEIFAEGWLQGQSAWGRPVDVLMMPDGALLVSDDQVGAIYRISYKPSR